jgi:hypothetical protein
LWAEKAEAGMQKDKESGKVVDEAGDGKMKRQDIPTERQGNERLAGSVWVIRQVTVRMRGHDEPTERKEDEKSGGSVCVVSQVTMRIRGQDGVTERKMERSGGGVGMTM